MKVKRLYRCCKLNLVRLSSIKFHCESFSLYRLKCDFLRHTVLVKLGPGRIIKKKKQEENSTGQAQGHAL